MDFKDFKDPFGFPAVHYLWVLALACLGGLVKHLNSMQKLSWGKLLIDLITSGFTGVMTFWMCETANIHGPMSAVLISVGGLMGNRAWKEFEHVWRVKFGLKYEDRREDRAPPSSAPTNSNPPTQSADPKVPADGGTNA